MTPPEAGWTWLGIARCGCIRLAAVDDGALDVAALLVDARQRGYRVERAPTEDVRTRPWVCRQHRHALQESLWHS